MKYTFIIIALLISSLLTNAQESFYDLKAETITGDEFDFSQLQGKKVLIVNTASKCGFTPQYEDLEALYEQYGGDNFTIIGFPANNFMKQEPGTDEEILEFCQKNYGVSFQMMSKISVKGDDMHPVYQWLTEKSKNGKQNSKVKWNFQKYLISEEGELIEVFSSKTQPFDEEIVSKIR